jgi:hypothetical protein
MGALRASELANSLSVEEGLRIHLSTNFYPAIPLEMIPTCIEAIDAVNSEGDWDKLITLPNGILWKGLTKAPASNIIEQHHLEFWIIESELD